MQKTLDLLERYVEWVALGLAGLILLWVAYAYVLTPITVKVGSRELTPGEVDAAVKREAADKLKTAMEDKTPVQFQVGDWRGAGRRDLRTDRPRVQPAYAGATDNTGQPSKTTQPAVPVDRTGARQGGLRGAVLRPRDGARRPTPTPRLIRASPTSPPGMAQKDVDWRQHHLARQDGGPRQGVRRRPPAGRRAA